LKLEIVIDQDRSLGYERKRWVYLLSLPIMWILTIWVASKKKVLRIEPKINTFWVDGLSLPCREIKEGAGSWQALDIIYNFEFGQQNGIRGKVSDYWIGMINAQAVRNRLRLVKRELTKVVRDIAQEERKIRLLSIASGSAQSIIEVIAEMRDTDIEAILLDLDPLAIEYSRKLARNYGVADKITFVVGSTSNLEGVTKGVHPHIIEMVGFLDYRPYIKAVRLVERVYKLLLPGGKLLTANIHPNPEQYFLKWVINWPMIHRKPEELRRILAEGGFTPGNCQIIYEPHKVQCVAICQKVE
jgi:ubiquinone/menaquinone biosynthesis C-methylase UbiE